MNEKVKSGGAGLWERPTVLVHREIGMAEHLATVSLVYSAEVEAAVDLATLLLSHR